MTSTDAPFVADPAAPRSRVILVREWEQQMSSSGCCGRLEGDLLAWGEGGERCFPERRRTMEAMGPLYRALRERYGDAVEIRVVDPRNLVSLLPTLMTDFRRYGVGLVDALRTLFGISVETVIVNGRIVSRGAWPEPERVWARLEGEEKETEVERAAPARGRDATPTGP